MNQKIVRIEQEKQDMIDNFKLSSSVLLERLKDLEAQSSMIGERPQTANVLSKISKLSVNFMFYSCRVSREKDRAAGPIIESIIKNEKTIAQTATRRFENRK